MNEKKEKSGSLYVEFVDGGTRIYKPNMFTDYEVRNGLLVVIKGIQWVGAYKMDSVKCFEYWSED